MAKPSDCLCHIEPGELSPLPAPYEDFNQVTIPALNPEKVKHLETSLDDTIAIGIPKPASKEEEEALVRRFLSGLQKAFRKGKQLDLSPAVDAFHGTLRQVPDLFQRLSRL